MTNLDDALRAMLRERATDIESAPATLVALAEPPSTEEADGAEVLELPSDRGPRAYRSMLLAAAAIVVLIAGFVIAVRASDDHRRPTPPAHHTTPAPAVTSVTTCRTGYPASWKPALAAATVTLPGISALRVEGVTSGGDAVVTYTLPADPPVGNWHVGYVAPGTSTLHHLYTVTGTSYTRGVEVSVQGDTVLLGVSIGNGVTPQELDLITVPSGARTVVTRVGPAGTTLITRAYLQDGHVYWQETRANALAIRDYDIARRTTRVATVDPILAMSQSGGGVQWVGRDGKTVTKGKPLPPAVAARVGVDNFDSLVTDGRAWAWMTGKVLEWWSPSSDQVIHLTGPDAGVSAMAGPLIFLDNSRGASDGAVLDVRTGAVVPVAAGTIIGHDGSFVGTPALSGVTEPSAQLMRVANTDLPAVSC